MRLSSGLCVAALLGSVLFTRAARADDRPTTRACAPADLAETYVLADFREIGGSDLFKSLVASPYLFFLFFPDDRWSKATFTTAPANLDVALEALTANLGTNSYTLQSDGGFWLKDSAGQVFTGHCAVVVDDHAPFAKDDLIMSGRESGHASELHLLFRAWTGGPLTPAVPAFDPAPPGLLPPVPAAQAISTQPPPAQTAPAALQPIAASRPQAPLVETPASLPERPAPIRVEVRDDARRGAGGRLWFTATNLHRAPLVAFMLVFRDEQTGDQWRDMYVDSCLERRPAWQPGQSWTRFAGVRVAMRGLQVFPGAALFADGSTWGNPGRLSRLRARRGACP